MLPNLSTLRLKPVPRDDLILVCNVDDIAAKRKLDEADAVDDSRFDTPIDAPDELLLYNLPDDILIQILSVPQDCESLLNMCSDIPEFSTICADDNHRFWQAVLLRKGWMVDWAKSGSEPGGISAKQFYLMVCDIATKQTPWKIPDAWMLRNEELALTALPSGITHIGKRAFQSCTLLALRALPPDLEFIGRTAFFQCTSLALQELPPKITTIEFGAFAACSSLALEKLPSNLTSIGQMAFADCTSLALQELPSKLTILPYGVFEGCTSLALEKLPSNLTRIERDAFDGCTSLALEALPTDLRFIGRAAFHNCKSLELNEFTELPPNLEIEETAFSGCRKLIGTPFGAAVREKQSKAFNDRTYEY